jgi:hypothetical protein
VCFIDYYIALEIRSDQKARLSLPMMSRTPRASFRARMRNPSCLISCIQPGPAGGSLAVDASKNLQLKAAWRHIWLSARS